MNLPQLLAAAPIAERQPQLRRSCQVECGFSRIWTHCARRMNWVTSHPSQASASVIWIAAGAAADHAPALAFIWNAVVPGAEWNAGPAKLSRPGMSG